MRSETEEESGDSSDSSLYCCQCSKGRLSDRQVLFLAAPSCRKEAKVQVKTSYHQILVDVCLFGYSSFAAA